MTSTTTITQQEQTSAPAKIPLRRALQGLAVLYLPPLLLALWAGLSLVAVVSGSLTRPAQTGFARWLRLGTIIGAAAPWLYFGWLRPWHMRWGATSAESRKPLPGDELVPNPAFQTTRAITIHAGVEQVWPWLAQVGQDRAGFYSYDWLENLAGAQIHNADQIHPEWQQRETGDLVSLSPDLGLPITTFSPNQALILKGWGAFVLEPIDDQTTRLLVRGRTPWAWGALLVTLVIELPHFIMERGMLLGLKRRAEADSR
jgi:hypothetical protein